MQSTWREEERDIKRGEETHAGGMASMMEEEFGLMHLQAKKCQVQIETTRTQKKKERPSPRDIQESHDPANPLISVFWPPEVR